MPSAYDWGNLQVLARSDGLAYTVHALAPGMTESSVDAQYTKAIAYWQSRLAEAGVATPPAAPVVTNAATGGTVLAGVYGAIVSYTSATGETAGSVAGTTTTSGSVSTITVPSPAAATGATGWYAYVTQAGGTSYTRQQAAGSPTAIGTGLTLTAPPTSTGQAPLTLNASGPYAEQWAAVINDAINHLIVRQAYLRNPVGAILPDIRT